MTEQKAKLDPKYLMEKPEIGDLLEKILIKYLVAGIFPETASQDSYLKVYNFVSHYANKDEEAGDLYVYFEEKIKAVSSELVKELTNKSNSEIIDLFIDVANRMDIFISFMSKTFSYVDFYYVKSKPEKKKLLTTALFIYRENIFMPVQKQLTEEVNKLLKEDRFGRKENRIKIKKVLSIMKTMDLTSPKIFKENNAVVWVNEKKDDNAENPIQKYWFNLYKEDTIQFTASKSMQDIQNRSTPEYVLIQLKFLDEEKNRQEELLNEIFLPELNAAIYEQIIGKHMENLIYMDSGVNNMLVNNKYEELTNLYELFKFYEESLRKVAVVFRAYIEKRGNALRENKEIYKDPKKMVPQLIDLQKEINTLVKNCFKNNDILQSAKDRAFYEFMKADYYSNFRLLHESWF